MKPNDADLGRSATLPVQSKGNAFRYLYRKEVDRGAFDFDLPIYQERNMSTPQSSTQSSTPAAPAQPGGLRAGTLGFSEVIGQSIANLSPTFTPSINVTAIAALAGAGT